MSLSDLAALGSFVSGAAVLASLVFLYFQMRQMTEQVKQAEKNQMAAIRLGRTNRIIQTHTPRLEPGTAAAIRKGLIGAEDISDEQIDVFGAWATIMFASGEDSFSQHTQGLLDEDAYASFIGSSRFLFSYPGFRVAWNLFGRSIWRNEFGMFFDKLTSEMHATSGSSRDPFSLANWRTAIAAETSVTRTSPHDATER